MGGPRGGGKDVRAKVTKKEISRNRVEGKRERERKNEKKWI